MWGNCRLFFITCMCRVNIVLPYPKITPQTGPLLRKVLLWGLWPQWLVGHALLCYLSGFLMGPDRRIWLNLGLGYHAPGSAYFFSLNHSHMVNFLFCYGSLDMQWVFLGKGQFLLKYFWKKTIWQCRLLKLAAQCCIECCVQPQCVDNQIVKSNFF